MLRVCVSYLEDRVPEWLFILVQVVPEACDTDAVGENVASSANLMTIRYTCMGNVLTLSLYLLWKSKFSLKHWLHDCIYLKYETQDFKAVIFLNIVNVFPILPTPNTRLAICLKNAPGVSNSPGHPRNGKYECHFLYQVTCGRAAALVRL